MSQWLRKRWQSDTLQPLWPSWEIKSCLSSWVAAIYFYFLPSSPFHLKTKTLTICSISHMSRCISQTAESGWLMSSILLSHTLLQFVSIVLFSSIPCLLYSAIFSPLYYENPDSWIMMSTTRNYFSFFSNKLRIFYG